MRTTKTWTALALALGVSACSSSSGPPPTSCSDAVTFRLDAPEGSKWYFSTSADTIDVDWLSVATSAGVGVPIALYSADPNDGHYCGEDDDLVFAIGSIFGPLPKGGTSRTWNGLYYAPGNRCVTPRCATPGQYVAKMCACGTNGLCESSSSTFTCVSVPFDYPASAPVVGTLPKD